MKVRIVNTVEGFKALEPAWNELHAQGVGASFFNSFAFSFVWWQTYGVSGGSDQPHPLNVQDGFVELSIFVIESDSNVVAIAPLYKTKSQLAWLFKIPSLRFIGRGADIAPDDLDVMLCADEAQALEAVRHLHMQWNELRGVQRILLEELPERSRFFELSCQCDSYLIERRQSRPVAKLAVSWSEFTATLSRNTRKRIKARRNRLNDAEGLSLNLCKDHVSMQQALGALIELHKMRQSAKGESPAFNTRHYIQFHENLVKALHSIDGCQFITLNDGEKIVGVEYLYCHNGCLLFYQTGFDPKYETVSPGHNMMVFAIENAIENGFTDIDLLKGDYPYKQSYADTKKESISASIYFSMHWRLFAKTLNAVRWLIKFVKSKSSK